jgi:hypothetical protein
MRDPSGSSWNDSGWPASATTPAAGREIHDLERVVPERCHEQAPDRPIQDQVIDPTVHGRQGNRAGRAENLHGRRIAGLLFRGPRRLRGE